MLDAVKTSFAWETATAAADVLIIETVEVNVGLVAQEVAR